METNAKRRAPGALVVIVLAAASLFMTWRPEIDLWFRISGSLLCAILFAWATMIIIGRTRSGRLPLTRRGWKYFTILGTVVALTITVVVISILAAEPDRYSSLVPPLYPMLLGLFTAYLYEPGGPPLFKVEVLGDREAGARKNTAIALAIIGISITCIAGIIGAAGNTYVLPLLLPIAIMLLVSASALWMKLRRARRMRNNS